ncbi:MAG: flagellar basal body-associated FliL family protein [Labilithrix sp.]|nr:flagellar basal body-associated FliL family protein [Labilithrix sp.]
MSETPDSKPKEAPAAPAAPAPAAAPAGKSSLLPFVALLLSALFSGGAAYGGARTAVKREDPAHAAAPKAEAPPPGPTMALDPFLVAVVDAGKKTHPVKLTVAVEFDATTKEESMKTFAPRIRDALLSRVRSLSYEDAIDPHTDKLRADLLESCKQAGASTAQRVLITDLVSQ